MSDNEVRVSFEDQVRSLFNDHADLMKNMRARAGFHETTLALFRDHLERIESMISEYSENGSGADTDELYVIASTMRSLIGDEVTN